MTSTPPAVTSSTNAVLAIPAETHHSSRTRLVAAARSGVASTVRATMSSSGPSELATRSRNQPLIASRMRAAMSGKPGPVPNGNGSRSRKPPFPDGAVVGGVGGTGAVVVVGAAGAGAKGEGQRVGEAAFPRGRCGGGGGGDGGGGGCGGGLAGRGRGWR